MSVRDFARQHLTDVELVRAKCNLARCDRHNETDVYSPPSNITCSSVFRVINAFLRSSVHATGGREILAGLFLNHVGLRIWHVQRFRNRRREDLSVRRRRLVTSCGRVTYLTKRPCSGLETSPVFDLPKSIGHGVIKIRCQGELRAHCSVFRWGGIYWTCRTDFSEGFSSCRMVMRHKCEERRIGHIGSISSSLPSDAVS